MKRILALLLILVLVFSLIACNKPAEKKEPEKKVTEKKEEKKDELKTVYPLEITTYTFSNKEVKVTFKETPKKVFVDGNNNLEIMEKLGLKDKIVGILTKDEKVKKAYGDKVKYMDWKGAKEPMIALNPDFILGWYGLFYKDSLGEVDFWHKKGINTYMSLNSGARKNGNLTVANVDGEMQDILNIGKIFDKQKEANKLVDEMKNEVKKVTDFIKKENKPKVRVAILETTEKGYRVYGIDSLAGDMAMKVGGELAVGEKGNTSIGEENLIKADPDVIMMVTYKSLGTEEEMVKKMMQKDKLKSLKAFKNKKIFAVDLSKVYASGLKTKDGLLAFAKAFYPELYEK